MSDRLASNFLFYVQSQNEIISQGLEQEEDLEETKTALLILLAFYEVMNERGREEEALTNFMESFAELEAATLNALAPEDREPSKAYKVARETALNWLR